MAAFSVAALTAALQTSALAQTTLTKSPDAGPYWHPLGSGHTTAYADSFVAPASGEVTELGTWLLGRGSQVEFQIWKSVNDDPGQGPDNGLVLATTGILSPASDSLALFTAPTLSGGIDLIAGQTYWFVATSQDLPGQGDGFQVGGHTQNSGGITDGGTFWYSNDPNTDFFDGQRLTPEMAFTLTVNGTRQSPVPDAGNSMFLMAFGVIGLFSYRRLQTTMALATIPVRQAV